LKLKALEGTQADEITWLHGKNFVANVISFRQTMLSAGKIV